jgi:hypothetical protein
MIASRIESKLRAVGAALVFGVLLLPAFLSAQDGRSVEGPAEVGKPLVIAGTVLGLTDFEGERLRVRVLRPFFPSWPDDGRNDDAVREASLDAPSREGDSDGGGPRSFSIELPRAHYDDAALLVVLDGDSVRFLRQVPIREDLVLELSDRGDSTKPLTARFEVVGKAANDLFHVMLTSDESTERGAYLAAEFELAGPRFEVDFGAISPLWRRDGSFSIHVSRRVADDDRWEYFAVAVYRFADLTELTRRLADEVIEVDPRDVRLVLPPIDGARVEAIAVEEAVGIRLWSSFGVGDVDEDGTATRFLASGDYKVVIANSGDGEAWSVARVTVPKGATTVEVTWPFAAPRDEVVRRVLVRDPAGAPVADADIEAENVEHLLVPRAVTGPDGSAELHTIRSLPFTLRVSKDGYVPTVLDQLPDGTIECTLWPATQVRVRLVPEGPRVRGDMLGVWWQPEGSDRWTRGENDLVLGLPRRPCRIVALAEDGWAVSEVFEPAEEAHEIDLQLSPYREHVVDLDRPDATIRVRCADLGLDLPAALVRREGDVARCLLIPERAHVVVVDGEARTVRAGR